MSVTTDKEWRVPVCVEGQRLDNPVGWRVYRGLELIRSEPNPNYVYEPHETEYCSECGQET